MTPVTPAVVGVGKFQGGQQWLVRAGGVGAVGLLLSIVGIFIDRKPALFSYLVSFAFWTGIAFAALILLMIFHAFRAKWMVVIRRPLEAMAMTVVIFLPLAIPLLALSGDVYLWASHDHAALPAHQQHLLHHKAPYLNLPFFIGRTIFYFAFAGFLASRLYGWSLRQDESGDVNLTQRQRNLGTGGLPFIALVITFAAFDWIMSLDPFWFSTIFGVYYFAGSMMAMLATLIITTTIARGKDNYGDHVSVEHLHNLGKLLFTFTAFWGYIAFSQMMLIWIANLPEEIPFYFIRMKTQGWIPWGIFLVVGHFFIPFFILLIRDLKRKPARLRVMAVWALIIHFADMYWLVVPNLNKEGPAFHWTLVTSWVGIGGLAIAFAISRVRGRFAIPVKDPFLDVSLRYRQPV